MKIALLVSWILFGTYSQTTCAETVITCTTMVKIFSSKTNSFCSLDTQQPCETTKIEGLYFPLGSELTFTCLFNDKDRKPIDLVSAKINAPVTIGTDSLSKGSRILFSKDGAGGVKIAGVTLDEAQEFRGHKYSPRVNISVDSKTGQPLFVAAADRNQIFSIDGIWYTEIAMKNGSISEGTLARPQMLSHLPVQNHFAVYPTGQLHKGFLSENFQFENWTFKKDSAILLAENGDPIEGDLAIPSKVGQLPIQGRITLENKIIKTAELGCPVFRLMNYKQAGWTLVKPGTKIEFDKQGHSTTLRKFDPDAPEICDDPDASIDKHPLFPTYWVACTKDSDCQSIQTRCGAMAANASYTEKIEHLGKLAAMTRKCGTIATKSATAIQCSEGVCH